MNMSVESIIQILERCPPPLPPPLSCPCKKTQHACGVSSIGRVSSIGSKNTNCLQNKTAQQHLTWRQHEQQQTLAVASAGHKGHAAKQHQKKGQDVGLPAKGPDTLPISHQGM